MRIVALSDTHAQHRDVTLPEGDVLVFAGDLMGSGYKHQEVKDFADWWDAQSFAYKILVAGNHDRMFEVNPTYCLSKFKDVIYLQDNSVTIDGVKFYGSPVQPWFCDWAFNVHRGAPIKQYWDKIPNDTDVLITHGPPYGILDQIIPGATERPEGYPTHFSSPSEHLGCEELTNALGRVKPAHHIFGHIHGSYGSKIYKYEQGITYCHNVAICDEQYNPVNAPIVIDL